MPQFAPSSVHVAAPVFSNPKSAGFDYQATLCMGATLTEMASASFHLNPGESKSVPFSVTMPSAPGTYPVYLKVSSGGVLIGTFVATEGVVIAAPAIIPWILVITSAAKVPSGVGTWMMARLNTSIRNPRTIQATEKVIVRYREYGPMWSDETNSWYQEWTDWRTRYTYEYTLAPGQTITPSFPLTAYPVFQGDYNYFLIAYQETHEFCLADVYGNTSNIVSIVN